MANVSTREKVFYIFLIFSVVIFTGLSVFKANRMASTYTAGSKAIQVKIDDTAARIRTGELELTPEQLAIILKTSADRQLDDSVIKWFHKHLLLFIFMFGGSTAFLLIREVKHANNSKGKHPR